MDWNNNDQSEREKTKLWSKLGCFFSVVIIGLLIISAAAWYLLSPQETRLKVSDSPNHVNSIEIVKREDFPSPSIRINYRNKSIMKTKIPDEISVEWKSDYEAVVTLTKQGREPDIVHVDF
ncbi:hypothetical protein GS18_0215985 [Metabacillus indicus]|uniref:Uncharacterized protein n=2 Tax=Metabacillus indicus TaxID=246786 RepID=A0A084GNK5_METID|nr:hypothetical protein GS18_0215985 [Metabacillus indicus]